MKKTHYFIIILISTIFTTSCTNKYENSIKNYIQTNIGNQLDISLKIKGTKELRTITVADSVNYLMKKKDISKEVEIAEIENNINKYQEIVVKGVDGRKLSKTLTEAYLVEINKSKAKVDSLKSMQLATITEYKGRKANEVLAIIVETSYEIENPNKETLTSNFVLSPDGKVCYGTTNNTDMLPEK